jgi:hypothetical protein
MNRRAFVIAGTVALATSRATGALESQAAKVFRLGVLTPGARPSPSLPVLSNILPGSLRELKYVEGQNLCSSSDSPGVISPGCLRWRESS